MAIITITTADHERTVDARPGDEIVVRLPENRTTGYQWQARTVSGPLSPAGDTYEPKQEMLVGSGGTRDLRYRALSEGEAQLRLHYWQPWEGEESITERLAVDIHIAP